MAKVDEVANLEFKWLEKRGVGGKRKEIQFYESFMYDGVKYALHDCVYMYKEGLPEPYIGKLVKIWEHSDKTRKVKVQWFFRPGEISNWLRDIEILENEIFLASGEGVGLANVNPLEAVAGHCNVVSVSKDCRNPQPSDEELKAADFVFFRTFDVQSCTVSEKISDKVGLLEIKYIFNRRESENASVIPKLKSDKEENKTTTSSEPQQNLAKTPSDKPNAIKADGNNSLLAVAEQIDGKGGSQVEGVQKLLVERESLAAVEPSFEASIDSCIVETNAEIRKTDWCIANSEKDKMKMSEVSINQDGGKEIKETPTGFNALKDGSSNSDKASKDEMKISDIPINKVEAKEKKKSPTNSRKLQDEPSKKNKSNSSTKSPKDKQVEVKERKRAAVDSDKSKNMPSKKAKVDDSIKTVDIKLKREEKSPLQDDNGKASLNPGASEEKPNLENSKVITGPGDSERGILKKRRADASLKVSDNNSINTVQKLNTTIEGKDGKDLIATFASSEDKSKPTHAMDSLETKTKATREPPGERKRNLSMTKSKSLKVSAASMDEDEKPMYQEFVVSPRPNAEKSKWFKPRPWEEQLQSAYDKGTAVLLHNLDPDYTSGEVEDIVWHAFKENCVAKMLPQTAVSGPHCGQALILFKTREAAERVLEKLDKECLMLPNKRPLVGTTCPPISPKKPSKFLGHLELDKIKLQSQREMDEAVSTSHFSQPNTIEYEMAMEWCLLQARSEKWWKAFYKKQGDELRKLEANLKRK